MANQKVAFCLILSIFSQVLSEPSDLADDVQTLLDNLEETVTAAIGRGIDTVKDLQNNALDVINQKNFIILESLNQKIDDMKNNLTAISEIGESAGVDTNSCFEGQEDVIDNIIADTKEQLTACYESVSSNLSKVSDDSIYRIDITINDVKVLSLAKDQCLSGEESNSCLESLQIKLQDALNRIPFSILQETVQAAKSILEGSIPADNCAIEITNNEDLKTTNILNEITDCVNDLLGL